jgi:hypothetical protein
LDRIQPERYVDHLLSFHRELGVIDGFSGLVVKALADPEVLQYHTEDVLRVLNVLSVDSVRRHGDELVEIARRLQDRYDIVWPLVEVLTRAGAWGAALRVCQQFFDSIADTTELQHRKLYARLHLLAVQFEVAIANGKLDELVKLQSTWSETELQIQRVREENAERDRLIPGLPR